MTTTEAEETDTETVTDEWETEEIEGELGWNTSFEQYHKHRDLEAEKSFFGTVSGVSRVSDKEIHIEFEVSETEWVIPLPCPECDPINPPEELFAWPEDTEYEDLIVFFKEVLQSRKATFTTLVGSELKIEFTEGFEAVKIDGSDHEYPINRPDGNSSGGSEVGQREDGLAQVLIAYLFGEQRGIEATIEFDEIPKDDQIFSIRAPVTQSESIIWVFDLSTIIPDAEKDRTYRFIEKMDGDPEFLAGEHVNIIHESEDVLGVENHHFVRADMTDSWILMHPDDYDEWNEKWQKAYGSGGRRTALPKTFQSVTKVAQAALVVLTIVGFLIANTLQLQGLLFTFVVSVWLATLFLVIALTALERLSELENESDDSNSE